MVVSEAIEAAVEGVLGAARDVGGVVRAPFDVARVVPRIVGQRADARLRVGVLGLSVRTRAKVAEAMGSEGLALELLDPSQETPRGVDVWVVVINAIEPLEARDKDWLLDLSLALRQQHVAGVVVLPRGADASRRAYLMETASRELHKRGVAEGRVLAFVEGEEGAFGEAMAPVLGVWRDEAGLLRARALADAASALAAEGGHLLAKARAEREELADPEVLATRKRDVERAVFLATHELREATSGLAQRLDAALDAQWQAWREQAAQQETEGQRVYGFVEALRGWMAFDLPRLSRDEAGLITRRLGEEFGDVVVELRRAREFARWSTLRPTLAHVPPGVPDRMPEAPSSIKRALKKAAPVVGASVGFWRRGSLGALVGAPALGALSRRVLREEEAYQGPPLVELEPELREGASGQLREVARQVVELLLERWFQEVGEREATLQARLDAVHEAAEARAELDLQIEALTGLVDAAAALHHLVR